MTSSSSQRSRRIAPHGLRHNGDVSDASLESLRKLCLALPETTERTSHGEPTWFVRDRRTFVMYADHHHDDRLGF
jgi:hypothetical protein